MKDSKERPTGKTTSGSNSNGKIDLEISCYEAFLQGCKLPYDVDPPAQVVRKARAFANDSGKEIAKALVGKPLREQYEILCAIHKNVSFARSKAIIAAGYLRIYQKLNFLSSL